MSWTDPDLLSSQRLIQLADLVLLEASPLEGTANTQRIRAVVLDGRLFDREALDEMLEGVEHAAREREYTTATRQTLCTPATR